METFAGGRAGLTAGGRATRRAFVSCPQTLEYGKVYVIGGLIDRNRHKGVCHAKARRLGCATAKLPLREHVEMTGSAVLTVNQVMKILVSMCGGGSIADADAVPARKRATDEGPTERAEG